MAPLSERMSKVDTAWLRMDTEDVLREVGVTPAQLEALRARGVIS